jgi:hypothetical protein
MGQDNIKEYLIELRKKGDNKFYSIPEIAKALKFERTHDSNLYNNVNQLFAFGYLDIKVTSYIPLRRSFRIKEKYIDNAIQVAEITTEKTKSSNTTVV